MKNLDRRKFKRLLRKKLIFDIELPTVTEAIYDKDKFIISIELVFNFPDEEILAAFRRHGDTLYSKARKPLLQSKDSKICVVGDDIRYRDNFNPGLSFPYIMTFKNINDATKFKLCL